MVTGLFCGLISLIACGAPQNYQSTALETVESEPLLTPVWVVDSTPDVSEYLSGRSGIETPISPLSGIEVVNFSAVTFERLAKSGAYWLRYNGLIWSEIEPREGERNWEAVTQLEEDLKRAAQNNLQVILVIRSTPEWAQAIPGSFCGPIRNEKMGAFAHFMEDVVARYSGAPYSIRYWELGNEPDIDPDLVSADSPYGCWGDTQDEFYGGGEYAKMLFQVYPKIKSVNPDAQVLVGGLLLDCDPIQPPENRDCRPARFLEGILQKGGGDFFDGVSFHAYDFYNGPFRYNNSNWHSQSEVNGSVNVVKARFIKNLLQKFGIENKFLVNSEAGLLCGRSGDEPICQSDEFNLTKAVYVAISNASGFKEGFAGNVWYSLEGWRGTGLVDSEGRPLPASNAFRFISAQLNQAVYLRAIQEKLGVGGIEYIRDAKTIWMLWSMDGLEHLIKFPENRVRVFDIWGNSQPGDAEVRITSAPVFVEWNTSEDKQ